MTTVHTVDLPLDAVIGVTWRPLNSVDLQLLARRTSWTLCATPRACEVPTLVAEAMQNIVAATVAERDGIKHHRHWDLLMPPTDGIDPDEFPVDPLGVAIWPWREQLQANLWDAAVADGQTPIGQAMLIGFAPQQFSKWNNAHEAR